MVKNKVKHERFMRLALKLSLRAKGKTSPNPLVGAVVVKKGNILGRGYHRRAGLAHAESVALDQAGRAAGRGRSDLQRRTLSGKMLGGASSYPLGSGR